MILFQIILGGIFANTIGKYIRYFFLKLIYEDISLKDLSGKGNDQMNKFSQQVINIIIGMITLIIVFKGIGWIYDTYFR